jgi:hypothetical protein
MFATMNDRRIYACEIICRFHLRNFGGVRYGRLGRNGASGVFSSRVKNFNVTALSILGNSQRSYNDKKII